MDFEKFLYIIWKQKPAGHDGFEGLVAKLLEQLTGQHFYLSRSGRQEGRDMATAGRSGNFLMAECKKYSEKLTVGELLSKYRDRVKGIPPDVWIAVTTAPMGEQNISDLVEASQNDGVAYLSIDTEGEEQSFLSALCAYAPEITVSHLQKYFADQQEADDFSSYLQSLKEKPEVAAKVEGLKQELSAQNIGYDHWRDTQNAWLCKRLLNKDESRAVFSQNIAVRAEGELFIPRKAAQEALDNWFANWHEQRNFFVVLGEEGDGKTWAVADWLYDKMSDGFPIIFLPSLMADCKELDILLPEILAKQLKEPYEGYWKKRLHRWRERPAGDKPLFLLVMDGLNERPDMEWLDLLTKFSVKDWRTRATVLMTCRKKFWDEHLSSAGAAVFTLGPYNNAELDKALAVKKLTRDHFDKNLIDLLRIPRYFDLTVRLWERMDSEGEITRERLIYEDWRDKQGHKLGTSLSHEAFQVLISDLSNRLRKSEKKRISQSELNTELSGYKNSDSLLTELSSGRVLNRHRGGWTINRDYVILGLGLLLAYEVADAADEGKNISEIIAHFQEPQPGMDLKVSICAMALYHALGEKEWPEEIHLALFNAWSFGRNIKEEDWRRITSYIPVWPEIYLRMLEKAWSAHSNNGHLRDVFKARFLQFGAQNNVKQALVPAFERWMGFVHSDGRGRLFNDEKARKEGQQHVQEALGEHFSGELFGYKLTVTENKDLLWLSRFMLAIISAQERTSYLRAILTGIIAGTVMDFLDFADELSCAAHHQR